jgi:Icc-related predicted phosphoesterase
VLVVSDVHGEFDALARLIATGETLLILGDVINLIDYRTGEGIISDVMGEDFGRRVSQHRGDSDYEAMRELWEQGMAGRAEELRAAMRDQIEKQYAAFREAIAGATGYATYGNVDTPDLLAESLPEGMRFVDGEVVEIDGFTFGFAGGGIATPSRGRGEVTDQEMAEKLSRIGSVDVLCTHLSPAVRPLHYDVITGRLERSSRPILDYILEHRPRFHLFGDIHQPQATRWRVGSTLCLNVGYFRATRRAFRFDPAAAIAS